MADYSADPRAARAASLLSSLKRMFVTLLEVVQTRLELASTELEEERARLQEIAIYGLVAVFFRHWCSSGYYPGDNGVLGHAPIAGFGHLRRDLPGAGRCQCTGGAQQITEQAEGLFLHSS